MSIHWNLPDGCTPDDIDIAMGASVSCRKCRFIYENEKFCPRCAFREEEADYLHDQERDKRAEKGEPL